MHTEIGRGWRVGGGEGRRGEEKGEGVGGEGWQLVRLGLRRPGSSPICELRTTAGTPNDNVAHGQVGVNKGKRCGRGRWKGGTSTREGNAENEKGEKEELQRATIQN